MNRLRIGEMLRGMGKLSSLDVDEILFEQQVAPRRFGDIAVAWGLCEQSDICNVWCNQVSTDHAVEIQDSEIDPEAAGVIPEALARALGVMPLRMIADQLVIAADEPVDSVAMSELIRAAGRDVRVVHAPRQQIERALDRFYAIAPVAA